jgi:gamma-glutamyltranspeptidase/glutathione hydrolase
MIIILVGIISCETINTEKVSRHGAVACSDPAAAHIGLQILRDGGNAVDAACAVAFALAVTFPQAGNIGGGGFALVYSSDSQEVYYLDFRETAPAAASTQVYLDSAGKVDSDKALIGPLAAGTPGTVAGLYAMHQRFGSTAWNKVVQPSRILADSGFLVGEQLAADLSESAESLRRFPATQEVFFPGGNSPQIGRRLIQADLALALALIEQGGRDGFYLGPIADAIDRYCAENGGLITTDDLANYQPVWRRPVHFQFRQLDVYTAGLPSSGGAVMGQIMKILDNYELKKYTANAPEYLHLFTEAARRSYADRSEYLGDPDFTDDPTVFLLDDKYLDSRMKSINPAHASSSAEVMPGMPTGIRESDQTTHLVVADSAGNIVSLTYTINAWFGCKAVVPGYGFLLNNEMDDFAILPDSPNSFGLTGSEANRIEPGKRMLSSMTPAIVFKSGQPCMALGSPGGSKIITAVAQTILNHYIFDMSLSEAVHAPRFHHQWLPDKLYVEEGGYDIRVIQKLISMGHSVTERTPFGEVMALGFSDDGAFITVVADHRRSGGTAVGY